MSRFPIPYEVELDRSGTAPMALTAGQRPVLVAGPPPEFGGTDTWWSPEHLLVAATASCMTATYYAMAERIGLHVVAFKCKGRGVLDKSEGGVSFTAIELDVELMVAQGDVTRARKLLDDAKARCFVASSLRAPVSLVAQVSPA